MRSDLNNAEVLLDRKAAVLARMGLVTRVDGYFRISNPSGVSGHQLSYKVERGPNGAIYCDCGGGSAFRCEHIRAVKFAIAERNTEALSSDNKTTTESGKPGPGEQKLKGVFPFAPGGRQSRGKKKETPRLKTSKGAKNMKQTMTEEKQLSLIPEMDNVLDFTATLKELRKHLDPNLVRQREGWRGRDGKVKMVDYIEWHTVADILDETAPNWEHRIKDIRKFDDIITVTVAITIDGVTREGIGTGASHTEKGIKKAEHDALKRAAVKFGIARDLYKKEFDAIEPEEVETQFPAPKFPAEPMAMSIADLVTTRQLSMIRALGREKAVDADAECQAVMSCKVAELSKRAASALIDHLQQFETAEAASVKRAS
ncbi:MAG TPA: Rad52/Rad22 family DNA repair protein [Pyrinomonadaceae bacterium]|nr:Rad52/Rad22 family DNA repair protein [Pyrinomonadaceae bacterium]